MIWFLMLFDTFLLEKVFFIHLFSSVFLFFLRYYVPSKAYLMQLEITTIIQPTFVYIYIFDHFSRRCIYILYIFIFLAKVTFLGFLSCISQLFTVFCKFLSCMVLFFHDVLYCIPVLLKKIAVRGMHRLYCRFMIYLELHVFFNIIRLYKDLFYMRYIYF